MIRTMNLKSLIPWKREDQSLVRRSHDDDPFLQMRRRMNGVFDEILGRSSSDLWNGANDIFAPQIELSENGNEVRINAELPGLDEKDVEVTLSGDLLTIKGEKKHEHEEEKGDYYRTERSYGYFQRSVQLPRGVDADKASAKFKKGVLKVSIPKRAEAQSNRRRIEVNDN